MKISAQKPIYLPLILIN